MKRGSEQTHCKYNLDTGCNKTLLPYIKSDLHLYTFSGVLVCMCVCLRARAWPITEVCFYAILHFSVACKIDVLKRDGIVLKAWVWFVHEPVCVGGGGEGREDSGKMYNGCLEQF